MDKVTLFFRRIFKNRVESYNGENVPVLSKHLPDGRTPSITIHNNGGGLVSGSEKLINLKAPLEKSNPLFNEDEADKLYWQQFRRVRNSANVLVNVWATTEQDRYYINEQVKTLIWMLKSDHYSLCLNFKDGTCESLSNECGALSFNNYHTAKGQCPKPEKYDYCSLFREYNIIRGTFKNHPEFNQDELNYKQAVLRTIHEFDLEYYDFWNLHGNVLTGTKRYDR